LWPKHCSISIPTAEKFFLCQTKRMCISWNSVLQVICPGLSNTDCHNWPPDSSHYSQTVHAKNRNRSSQNIYNVRPCHSSYEPLMMDFKAVSETADMNCLLTQLTFKEVFIAYTQYKSLHNAMFNCKNQVNKNSRKQKMTQTVSLQLHSKLNDCLYENLQI
jgi:hypothetical protein